MFYHTLPYSRQLFVCDIKKGEKKMEEKDRNA